MSFSMELPVLLSITSLIFTFFPWQLHAQDPELIDVPDVMSDPVATQLPGGAATAMFSAEFRTEFATTSVDAVTKPVQILTVDSTSEDFFLTQTSTAPSLSTETTTIAVAQPTAPALPPTTPEATGMPLTTAPQETTTPEALDITPAPVDQGTSPSPITATSRAHGVIPTPPPTTPAVVESTSTSAPLQSTPAAQTIGTPPPIALTPAFIPFISSSTSTQLRPSTSSMTTSGKITDSSSPTSSPKMTTSGGNTDSSSTDRTSTILDPSLVEGLSPVKERGNQSDKPVWPWIVVAFLLTALASAACIALFIKHRKQKRERGLDQNGTNGLGQKKKKKGKEDTWAGPMLTEEAEKDEANGYNGDEEDNNDGGPGDGTQPMLSTFAPYKDEERAVGADGTKEAQKWEEQSPLLYIDEDIEDEVDDGVPANQKPTDSALEGRSSDRMQAEGSEVQKKGEAMGGALNGAVAFCQTTAV